MITSRGPDTRILSKEELKKRDDIMRRPDQYTTEEIANHDLTGETRGRKYDPETYKVSTSPIDQRDSKKRFDIRKRPEIGD